MKSSVLSIVIPRAVHDEVSERGGVSHLVLPKRAYAQEPGGLRRPAQKPLTLCRVRCIASLVLANLCLSTFGADAAPVVRPKLQIINGGTHPVEVFWLKSDTERLKHATIATGKNLVIETTLGHRFALQGEKGEPEVSVTSEIAVQAYRYDPQAKDGVPSFYTQRADAHGYPVVASANVNPYALKEAVYLIDMLLAKRPDVRAAMIKSGSRMCLIAHNEFTTDQPEFAWLGEKPHADFPKFTGREYYDARARGLGGSQTDPFCSCAEENLLGYPGDPYEKENILIHEFAHNIHLRGMMNVDPTFDARVERAYADAMKSGLWKGKYASVNHHEYFAEGVQSWFDNNRINDTDHNHVHLRSQLIEYDPGLAALCREVFGDTELRYTKPATRLTGHLAGYDPGQAPKFEWPDRLANIKAEIRTKAEARSRHANSRETRNVSGWSVLVSKDLLATEPALTAKSLELLQGQLDEIVRVVPATAVTELQKVKLYFSPEYLGVPPRAEYHPDAGWLREHQRDPVMAKGVEFTNVRIFEAETRRMPNFALHELAHAYHDRVLGNDEARIIAAYDNAKASGTYDQVQRQDSEGRKRLDKAYALTNHKEYFAECTEAYFSRNDFFPFHRAELKAHDPAIAALIEQLWKVDNKP